MKSNLLRFVLSIIMILGVLTSVAMPSVYAQEKVTLRVAVYAEPARTAAHNLLLEEFAKKYPHIEIALESADFNTYYTKLNTNIAARRVPDVFMMSGAYFYRMAMQGVLQDLGPFIERDNLNMDDYFWEPANTIYQGTVYGLPLELATLALAYNKDLFDEACVAYPTDDWTWDDMLEAAQKLTRTVDGKTVYGIYSSNSAQEWWGNLVKQNGGSFLSEDMKSAAIDSPEAIEAIQFAIDLIYKHKVSPTPQAATALPGYIESGGSPFMTGLVAMKFQGNYELGLLTQQDSFRWGLVTMPGQKIKGGLRWSQSWVMSANTKVPEEAWQFISFYLSEEFQNKLANLANRGITPPLKSAAYSPEFSHVSEDVNLSAYLDTAHNYPFEFEWHPAWFEYQDAYSRALAPAFEGKMSVEEAVENAAKEVDRILAPYQDFQP